jgi:SAM-dependent methyltransferase
VEKTLLKNVPYPFNFYRYILKGDHLHFGFWSDDNLKLSIEEAQQAMFTQLLSFLPEPPATVLDVGCGLGLSAGYLSQKGYEVTAISPSQELIDYAKIEHGKTGARFETIGFFDDDETVFKDNLYDIVFFQESAQYLNPLDTAIKKARHILKDKGLIIIGDEVCYDENIKSETAVHTAVSFTVSLAENGFRILENQKIGRNVIQTCDFIINAFEENFDRIVSVVNRKDASENLLYYLDGWKKQRGWYLAGQTGYEIFIAKKDSFFKRAYSPGDEYKILPLFNDIFKVDRTMEHWFWKFRDNPFGSHKIFEAFSGDDRLVAHYAGYPVPFYSSTEKTRQFFSCQIGDTMTSPEVRNIGLGKTGLLAQISHHFCEKFCRGKVPFIYGFNTGKIKKIGMRYLGYQYIDPVTLWVRDILKTPFKPPKLLTRLIGAYSVEEIHSVNGEWDDLFNRVCNAYKFLVRRDADYVLWRYISCPDKVHRIFAVRKSGRLVGWSVFRQEEKKIIWGDALFDCNYPGAVSYLLYRLYKNEFSDSELIEGWFPPNPEWWCKQLKELNFDDPALLGRLQENFYYTIGDSDLF